MLPIKNSLLPLDVNPSKQPSCPINSPPLTDHVSENIIKIARKSMQSEVEIPSSVKAYSNRIRKSSVKKILKSPADSSQIPSQIEAESKEKEALAYPGIGATFKLTRKNWEPDAVEPLIEFTHNSEVSTPLITKIGLYGDEEGSLELIMILNKVTPQIEDYFDNLGISWRDGSFLNLNIICIKDEHVKKMFLIVKEFNTFPEKERSLMEKLINRN